MALDNKKALTFDCNICDRPSQRLRNCNGSYPDAVNLLNLTVYTQCPKAQWLGVRDERNLLALYIDCRESKRLPDHGSLLDQTAFTYELFTYLDGLMAAWRAKKQAEHDESAAKINKQIEAQRQRK